MLGIAFVFYIYFRNSHLSNQIISKNCFSDFELKADYEFHPRGREFHTFLCSCVISPMLITSFLCMHFSQSNLHLKDIQTAAPTEGWAQVKTVMYKNNPFILIFIWIFVLFRKRITYVVTSILCCFFDAMHYHWPSSAPFTILGV